MSEQVKALVKEIAAGPATLLVYGLAVVGGGIALFADQGVLNDYLALIDKLDVPIAALAGGRGIAAAGKAVTAKK